jgi:iron complex transport system ATP-binding protein
MAQALEAIELTCGYGITRVVQDVTLAVAPGETVALVGPNGAGKTTLLQTLAGALPPLGGRVRVRAADVSRLDPAARARHIALLPQDDPAEAGLTVREMVELGRTPYLGLFGRLSAEDEQAVDGALAACQIEELANRRVDRISGGERQRARIAMTVAQQPDVLLLDEPANHLDLRRRYELYALLARLRREHGLAVVLILHDLTEAYREAHRVLVVHSGRVELVASDDASRTRRLAQAFGVPDDRIPV